MSSSAEEMEIPPSLSLPNPKKLTRDMSSALQTLQSSLLCPMCDQVMVDPSTLHCAHSFCLECITSYDRWQCPVKGCGLPISMRGTKQSYVNINPQLSSVVTCFEKITETIDSMKDGWWKRSVTSGGDVDDGGDEDAPNVSFTSSEGSPPRTDVTVSFAMDGEDRRASYCGGGEGTPSPPSALRNPMGSSMKKKKVGSDSSPIAISDGGVASKRTKTADQSPQASSLRSTTIATTTTVTSATTIPYLPPEEEEEEEDGSDAATQIYSGDDVATNSDTLLDHESGDGSLGWSNVTRDDLNQSCPIMEEDPGVSPIDKGGSQSQSQSQSQTDSRGEQEVDDEGKGNMVVEPMEGVESSVIGTENEGCSCRKEGEDGRKIDAVGGITTALEAEAMVDSDDGAAATLRVASPSVSNTAIIEQKKEGQDKNDKEEEEEEVDTPYAFLLSSPTLLPASDLRCMRKCLGRGNFFMLRNGRTPGTSGDGRPCSDLDFNFNFESEDDVHSFQSSLFHSYHQTRQAFSSDGDRPPPPSPRHSYAICFNSEFQTCDGFISPRTFHYLLAVACGLPIVDFSFIRSAATSAGRGYLHVPDLGDTPAVKQTERRRGRGRGKKKDEPVSLVVGDVESGSWTGPTLARNAVRERLQNLSSQKPIDPAVPFHNGLLVGYTVLLCGTYDTIPVSVVSGRGRKRARSSSNAVAGAGSDGGGEDGFYPRLYSRGRLLLLLMLCGARVLKLEAYAKDSPAKKEEDVGGCNHRVVILANGDRGFRKLAQRLAVKCGRSGDDGIAVVDYRWVLDSIAEFQVKDLDSYRVEK